MTRTIVAAQCTRCGATVKRMLATVQHTPEWREHVVCPACRESESPTDAVIDEMLAAQHADRWRKIVARFDAAAGYQDAALSEPPEARWEQLAAKAVDELQDGSSITRSGLMLVGPTGIGKTWAAFAVANYAAQRGYADAIRVSSEVDLLGAQVAPWQLREQLGRWVEGARVLIVDDIGVASRQQDQIQGGWKQLCDLIAAQPHSMLVIGTSNRQSWTKAGGLVEWIGQQSTSRLRSWLPIATTGVVDRRTGETHQNWADQVGGKKR